MREDLPVEATPRGPPGDRLFSLSLIVLNKTLFRSIVIMNDRWHLESADLEGVSIRSEVAA